MSDYEDEVLWTAVKQAKARCSEAERRKDEAETAAYYAKAAARDAAECFSRLRAAMSAVLEVPVPEGEKDKPNSPPANAAHPGSSVQGQAGGVP